MLTGNDRVAADLSFELCLYWARIAARHQLLCDRPQSVSGLHDVDTMSHDRIPGPGGTGGGEGTPPGSAPGQGEGDEDRRRHGREQ